MPSLELICRLKESAFFLVTLLCICKWANPDSHIYRWQYWFFRLFLSYSVDGFVLAIHCGFFPHLSCDQK